MALTGPGLLDCDNIDLANYIFEEKVLEVIDQLAPMRKRQVKEKPELLGNSCFQRLDETEGCCQECCQTIPGQQ